MALQKQRETAALQWWQYEEERFAYNDRQSNPVGFEKACRLPRGKGGYRDEIAAIDGID